MTTQKQAAANKENAKKSTGPQTPEGKSVVAGNAIKHGIFSHRLLLAGESADQYNQLHDEMDRALQPVGILERALSEKIAAAIWKQRRLVEAETASIELSRDLRHRRCKQHLIEAGFGSVETSDLVELTAEDQTQIDWCKVVIAEVDLVDNSVLETPDLSAMAEIAPMTYKQFMDECAEEELEPMTYITEYLEGGLLRWALDLGDWCKKELAKFERRPIVQAVAKLVQSRQSAPLEMELLARYQVSLDAELYRAMEALRKQQEWRIKSGIEIDGELVSEAA